MALPFVCEQSTSSPGRFSEKRPGDEVGEQLKDKGGAHSKEGAKSNHYGFGGHLDV